MANLEVRLPWFTLKHPVLAGASPATDGSAAITAVSAHGVAGVVTSTLLAHPPLATEAAQVQVSRGTLVHRRYGSWWPLDTWLRSEAAAAALAARAQGIPLIASVGGDAEAVPLMGARLAELGVDGLELSLHGTDREAVIAVAAALRGAVNLPVIAKLSPHHGEDLADLALELEPYVDAFTCIGSFGPVLSLEATPGGAPLGLGHLSGAAVRPIAQRFVFEVARRVSKPVIASGGVTSGHDVIEMLMLGASAVQVCTHALLQGPGVFGQIAGEVNDWLDSRGYASVAEVTGAYLRKYGGGQRVVLEKEESPQLSTGRCVKCSICQQVCTYGAIVAPLRTLPQITADACTQCGLCVSACPKGALAFLPRDGVTKGGNACAS